MYILYSVGSVDQSHVRIRGIHRYYITYSTPLSAYHHNQSCFHWRRYDMTINRDDLLAATATGLQSNMGRAEW